MKILRIVAIWILLLSIALPVYAQSPHPSPEYTKGEVARIHRSGTTEQPITSHYQDIAVRITEGNESGKVVQIRYSGLSKPNGPDSLSVGDVVIVQKSMSNGEAAYNIHDKYRLDVVLWILIGFFIFIVLIAGIRGAGSILGMLFSLGVILFFIVPHILNGRDPLLISIIGAYIIMLVTIYLAHGFSKQTSIAVASTALVLSITGIISYLFVHIAQLTGLGSEDFAVLQLGNQDLNVQGLLLGGIIIGALGVLDDITTAQTAAVFELHKSNPSLSVLELIKRGYRIGREHITSLVNTLVLAYAGTSIALFILFILNPSHQPHWVILNSQEIIEEVIRALSGSIGLVLAVPITTTLAAWYIGRKRR